MILTRTFTVKVEDAEFDFKRPNYLDQAKKREALAATKSELESLQIIFGDLVAVRNLYNEDRTQVQADELRQLTIPFDFAVRLINLYSKRLVELTGAAESAEKK